MARMHERAFALFGAILFLVTSSVTAVAVIIILIQNHKQDSTAKTTPAPTTKQLTGTKLAGFTPLTGPVTELSYTDTKVGTGDTISATDKVEATYVGALTATGVIFDASADHGGTAVPFNLNGGVIPGFSKGMDGMKVGGSRRILIPAAQGYGASGAGASIPPNADLVFDVTVTKKD